MGLRGSPPAYLDQTRGVDHAFFVQLYSVRPARGLSPWTSHERTWSRHRNQRREFFSRGISGRIVMLNLMRFRATADDAAAPHLAPETPDHRRGGLSFVHGAHPPTPREGGWSYSISGAEEVLDRAQRRKMGRRHAREPSKRSLLFRLSRSNQEYMSGMGSSRRGLGRLTLVAPRGGHALVCRPNTYEDSGSSIGNGAADGESFLLAVPSWLRAVVL